MVSLPLAAEGSIVGALNLYAGEPDAFDADIMSVAELVAAHIGLAIQVAAALFGHRDLHEQLADAMKSRAVIEQAKGMLMSSHNCSADEAFQILTRLSQNSHRKLRDVAAALVAQATQEQTGT